MGLLNIVTLQSANKKGVHTMDNITILGIDIAKNVFQLHGIDKNGKVLLQKRISRAKLPIVMANLPPCLIGMEACSSSNYWALKFEALGHTVKLMSPQYVKPYVKTNKNDMRDAEAICEAVTRPTMRFVAVKSKDQQAIQGLHRIRERLVKNRTALINQIRSLLGEYGVVIPQGPQYVKGTLLSLLEIHEQELTPIIVRSLKKLHEELEDVNKAIKDQENEIKNCAKENDVCRRLMTLRGIGFITATALISAVGDINIFKNGRSLAAWLGLVPRQHSSGNKQVLLGITKRGDKYLRKLLIHGARAGLSRKKILSESEANLIARRGLPKACVAFANKNARIAWAIMKYGTEYQPDYRKAA